MSNDFIFFTMWISAFWKSPSRRERLETGKCRRRDETEVTWSRGRSGEPQASVLSWSDLSVLLQLLHFTYCVWWVRNSENSRQRIWVFVFSFLSLLFKTSQDHNFTQVDEKAAHLWAVVLLESRLVWFVFSYFFHRKGIKFSLMVVKGNLQCFSFPQWIFLGTGVLICSSVITIKVLMAIKFFFCTGRLGIKSGNVQIDEVRVLSGAQMAANKM